MAKLPNNEQPGPIPVKEAVQIAYRYLQELYSGEDLRDLRLEEVELDDLNDQWLVTFGFTVFDAKPDSQLFGAMLGALSEARRDYKTIALNASTGALISMKMRILQ